jgi:hypothetical protein
VLTRVGDERERPEFEVNRGGLGSGYSKRRRRAEQQGGGAGHA